MRRPTPETIRSMTWSRCRSSWKRTSVFSSRAVPLDEHLLRGVDQDVGDRLILDQRLQRAQAEDLVQHLADRATSRSSKLSGTISCVSRSCTTLRMVSIT